MKRIDTESEGWIGLMLALGFIALVLAVFAVAWCLSGCATVGRHLNQHYAPGDTVLAAGTIYKPLPHYPRRMFRVTARGDGSPMLNVDGTLNGSVLDSIARYDIVSIYAPPLVARPDIVEALLKRNPALLILATLPGGVWENPHPALGDTTNDLAWARWRVVRDHAAFLYGTSGGWFAGDDNVDRADHRAALALAGVDARAVVGGVAGLWLDTLCPRAQAVAGGIDWKRAGFSCADDWERAYTEGHRIYVERLRSSVPAGTLLVGNCGPSGEQDVLNGWMREGFPYQNGGSWETNMLGYDGNPGYLIEQYVRPRLSILAGWHSGDVARDSVQFLFGLASATLGDGAWEQDAPGINTPVPFYWPREFDMDLGQPRGKAYFDSTRSVWRRDFVRGFVEVDPYARTGKVVTR